MNSAKLIREQAKNDRAVDHTQPRRTSANANCRWPRTLNEAHSPALHLGQPFAPPHNQLPHVLQTKLTVSQAGDQYEQEADRVAEQVMRAPSTSDRSVINARSQAFSIQRRPDNRAGTSTPDSVNFVSSLGNGQRLDHSTREFFESRLGNDLSDVQVHTGTQAARSARSINARAYTLGSHMVFAAGQYQPHTSSGKELLAHELTHTLQQRDGAKPAIQRKLQVGAGLTMDTQGFNTSKTGNVYTCPAIVKNSIWNELFTSLLFSARVFTIQGASNQQVNANLLKHIAARLGILDFASKKKYSFGAGSAFKMNPDFWFRDPVDGWVPKPGIDRQKAINDLNVHPAKYSIACQAASQYTMEGGSKSPLTDDVGVSIDDWIPGDWGYIENTKFPAVGGIAGLEGENIIYTWKDMFWGHFGPGNEYKTLQQWFDQVKSWNGGAKHENYRTRPTIGLT